MKHIRFMRYFISLALPVILQQLLAHLLAMSDTIMLGAFSEQAISAVSVANNCCRSEEHTSELQSH